MTIDLAFTPSGRLALAESAEQAPPAGPGPTEGQIAALKKAFAASQAEGLFTLAATWSDAPLAPSLAFWHGFAGRYLEQLCRLPDIATSQIEPIPPPDTSDLKSLLLGAPPMQGAEYLSEEALVTVWTDLDSWVRGTVAANKSGLSGFLKDRAPLWHQVGRVCFHLAENRADPDYPFAFLATYAPALARGARVQYQPLSKALREYAGEKNKSALVRLLSPVHQASQKSRFVKELVESGDIYQPLAWTPREAYRFLTEMPVLDECGVLVRLPNWWKKRPRPRVAVSIGENRQKKFSARSMLDFKVGLALGDERLTEDEWRQLMSADEGLVLLRGQWVEVDRDKLAEALQHWKKLEQAAGDGISFVEGMRLLAGANLDPAAEERDADPEREWSFVHAGQWLGEILAKVRNPESLEAAEAGNGLLARLRPYRTTGFRWLRFMSELGLGACLADDMGLGKTIQVLALAGGAQVGRKHAARGSWSSPPRCWELEAEIDRFAPSLRTMFVHSSETPKDRLAQWARDAPPSAAWTWC